MAAPTYLQRVQKVLSDLAKAHILSIEYLQLLRKVRPRTLRSSVTVASTFRAGIRQAILYEVKSGRVKVATTRVPASIRVHFTPEGTAFFTALVLPSPSGRRNPPPRAVRPSLKVEATNEYQALVAILRSIQMLFAQRTFATAECYTIAKLSKMVRCYLDLEHDLRQHNFALGSHLDDLEWELTQMQAALPAEHGTEG